MNAFRQILKDRVAGAGALAIIVQLLLIQALVTSFTCSTMSTAAYASGGGFEICHGAVAAGEPDAASSPHRGGSGGACLDCPCAVCCANGTAIFAIVAPNQDLGPAYTLADAALDDHPVVVEAMSAPLPRTLKPDSTAPPFDFV